MLKARPLTRATALSYRVGSSVATAKQPQCSHLSGASRKETYVSDRLRTKNLLRSVASILPRILENEDSRASICGQRLKTAMHDLSDEGSILRLGVWGFDSQSGHDLVTSILEDPLSSDDTRRTVLANRLRSEDFTTPLRIRFGPQSNGGSQDELRIASPWLQLANAEIVEVQGMDSDRIISELLRCQICLLVLDSIEDLASETTQRVVAALSCKDELYIVLNTRFITENQIRAQFKTRLVSALQRALPTGDVNSLRLRFLATDVAINSQASFRHFHLQEALHPSSPASRASQVDRFRKDLISSGIPQISQEILNVLKSYGSNGAESSALTTALDASAVALVCGREATQAADGEVIAARNRIAELRSTPDAALRTARIDMFDSARTIQRSVEHTHQALDKYIGSLPWWKLPWRADDIASDFISILKTTYARDLERDLIFHTGRFAAQKKEQDVKINQALTFSPGSPFISSLLINSIEQLEVSTSLSPTSLTKPISRRLEQLTGRAGSPVAHLQLRTQILVLQAYGLSLGGPAVAWGGWSTGYIGDEVALGGSALGFLAGLRWAAGRWERAKKKWHDSMVRIDEGLERDLEEELDNLMRTKVMAKTVRAADGLESIVSKRHEKIKQLSVELTELEEEQRQLKSNI